MKNWKKGILGVALSFMILFVGLGYAQLEDDLYISGSLTATAPNDIFITKITSIEGLPTTQTGLRSMETTVSGEEGDTITYAIEVFNNTKYDYVYAGASEPFTVWTSDGKYEITDAYVSGTPIKAGETKTINVQYTFTSNLTDALASVEFYFKEPVYTITYINNGETLDVRYVLDYKATVDTGNKTAVDKVTAQMGGDATFDYWMNSGNSKIATITYTKEEDVEDVVLYPKFSNLYTAMFVDQDGGLLAWSFFNHDQNSQYYYANDDTVEQKRKDAQNLLETEVLPKLSENLPHSLQLNYWEVKTEDSTEEYDITNFANYTEDVTIYARLKYPGAELIPVDSNNDGDIETYQVNTFGDLGATDLVVIPSYIGIDPVTTINAGAFQSYEDLHAVLIPSTVTDVGDYILAEKWAPFDDGETVTIYYAGSRAEWEQKEKSFSSNWEGGIGSGSRIFFLNGTGKVDPSQGYYEATKKGYALVGTAYIDWGSVKDITEALVTEYTGYCTCKSCKEASGSDAGQIRPDAGYWTGVTVTATASEEETTP